MNERLKRFFIFPFLLYITAACIWSGVQLWEQGAKTSWLLAFFGQAAALMVFVHLMLKRHPRNDWLPYAILAFETALLLWLLWLLVMQWWLLSGYGMQTSGLATLLLAVTVVGFVLYLFWYTPADRNHSRIQVGRPMPGTYFADDGGKPVSTRGQGRSVWVFIRGNWCPLCVTQVEELATHYQQLADLGASVFVVSAQNQEQSARLARRFDVPITFLTDPGLTGSRELGIDHVNGVVWGMIGYEADTIFPTVVVTDADGTVLFADQTSNYRERADPERFIRLLEQQRLRD